MGQKTVVNGINQLRKLLKEERNKVNKCSKIAINKGVLKMRTKLKGHLKNEYTVMPKEVMKGVSLKKASLYNLNGSLTVTATRLGIDNIRLKSRFTKKRRLKPIVVNIKRINKLLNSSVGTTSEGDELRPFIMLLKINKTRKPRTRVEKANFAKNGNSANSEGETKNKLIVARRKTKSKYPTMEVKTISVAEMFRSVKVKDKVEEEGLDAYEKEFERLMKLDGF